MSRRWRTALRAAALIFPASALAASALAASALVGGCSLLTSFDDAQQAEESFQHCRDGSDNDNDGLIDCDDQGCVSFTFCKELTVGACSNGKDDDNDGFVDCQDQGCKVHESICSEKTVTACSNKKDDDDDGLVDCKDPDCRSLKICQEATDTTCADKLDNDSDGLVDCLDFECFDNRASCCKIDKTPFTGDDFSFKATCSNVTCTGTPGCCSGSASSCCSGTYECAAFDPSRWVVWGWPRPRLEKKAFVVNEPCGCDVSGLVSVEHVNLMAPAPSVKVIPKTTPVLSLAFNLTVPMDAKGVEMVCAGLTRTDNFPDHAQQCLGTSQPRLLGGVCLSAISQVAPPDAGPPPDAATPDAAAPDAAAHDAAALDAAALDVAVLDAAADTSPPDSGSKAPHLSSDSGIKAAVATVIIDGQIMVSTALSSGGPYPATVTVAQDGHITVKVGGITYKSQTGIDPSLTLANVAIYGHGNAASLDSLVVKDEAALTTGCQDPSAWLRHLSKGNPVLQTSAKGGTKPVLVAAEEPSVLFNPKTGLLLMAFAGRAEHQVTNTGDAGGTLTKTVEGIFWAKSTLGFTWEVHGFDLPNGVPAPVIPPIGSDTTVAAPDILLDGALVHMWYAEQISKTPGGWRIRHETSTDGISWTPDPKAGAGLAPAKGTAWDSLAVTDPTVVKRPDGGGFYMWYTGTASVTGAQPAIGLASSPDGSIWTRVGTSALLSPQAGANDLANEDPAVVWDKTMQLYRMWYTNRAFGQSPTIRYAVSTDGKSWVPWSKGAVLTTGPPGSFDARGVRAPAVMLHESHVRLWYTGVDANSQLHLGYVENRGSK